MKDRFTITIHDINGVKQYTLKQFFKKIFIFLIIFILLAFLIGGGTIWYLYKRVNELTELRYKLERENELLVKKNKELQETIAKKEQELGELVAKIRNIEEMMGIKEEPILLASNTKSKEKVDKLLSKLKVDLKVRDYMFKHIPNGAPIYGRLKITSGYGYRFHPILKRRKFHAGIDLKARYGQPVIATADGIVEYAGWKAGYGKTVIIQHNFGFKTVYAHLSSIKVRVGRYVKKGQVIGYAGSTGRSTGTHVHYEVRYLQRPINPIYFIRWKKKNYKTIFKKVRVVRWAYLVKVIGRNFRLKAQKQQ